MDASHALPTDGPTDQQTDGPMDQQTDGSSEYFVLYEGKWQNTQYWQFSMPGKENVTLFKSQETQHDP